jgi:anti-anti-sigma factor
VERDRKFECLVEPDREMVRIRVIGALDVRSARTLDLGVCDLLAVGFRQMLVDLSEATFIDGAGLRVLVHHAGALAATGGHIHVIPPSAEVKAIFDLPGLRGCLVFEDAPKETARDGATLQRGGARAVAGMGVVSAP